MNTSGGFALMKSFCFVCAYWSSCFLLYQFLNLSKIAFLDGSGFPTEY